MFTYRQKLKAGNPQRRLQKSRPLGIVIWDDRQLLPWHPLDRGLGEGLVLSQTGSGGGFEVSTELTNKTSNEPLRVTPNNGKSKNNKNPKL